eukprot:466996_1
MAHAMLALAMTSVIWVVHVESTVINSTQQNVGKTDIVCDSNEDCTINCLGKYSCQYYTIHCPRSYQCNLLCTYFGACKNTKLIGESVGYLNILCQTDTRDSHGYGEACNHLNVTATGWDPYSSSVHIQANVLDSTESSACKSSTFSLHNFHQLSLDCNTKRSCSSIHLISDNNHYVDLKCGADFACTQTTMVFNSTETMTLSLSPNALYHSTMMINTLYQRMNIDCSNDACFRSVWHLNHMRYGATISVDCGNGTNVHNAANLCSYSSWNIGVTMYKFEMKCDGYYSCNNLDIKGDCSKATIDCLDGCRTNTINLDDCANNDDIFGPTNEPTVSPIPASGSGGIGSAVDCTSSSTISAFIVLFALVICGILLVCFAYYVYKAHRSSDAPKPTRLQPHPLPPIKEEAEAMTISGGHEGGAIISSVHTKQEKGKDLHKEQLLVTTMDDTVDGDRLDVIAIRRDSSWCDTMWLHKEYYLQIIPHLLDNVLFVCVVVKLYTISRDAKDCPNINMFALYICSCLVLVIYRGVCAAQIMYWTHNVRQTILQLFDLEVFEALMVNYKYSDEEQKANEYAPCSPQTWLSLNEVAFQTAPMAVLLSIYIIATGYIFDGFGILHVTLMWCFIHICLVNTAEDRRCWKRMPSKSLIFIRFADGFCRIVSISLLMASNALIGSIVVILECVMLFAYAVYKQKHITVGYHLLVRSELFDNVLMGERCAVNCIMIGIVILLRLFNPTSPNSLLNSYDTYYLLGCVVLYSSSFHRCARSIRGDNLCVFDSNRSMTSLMQQRLWKEILDFVYFGVNVTPSELLQKNEELFEIVSEDFEAKGGKLFLYFLMKGTDLSTNDINGIWRGTLQAYENKDEPREAGYIDLIELLNNIMKSPAVDINWQTQLNARTILHILCLKRHCEYLFAKVLTFEVLNPNILDKNDESALHMLCNGRTHRIGIQTQMVKHVLLLANINVNIQSERNQNQTPLHFCVKHNNKALVPLFVSHPLIDLAVTSSTMDNYLHFAAKHNGTDDDIAFCIFNNDKFEFNVNDSGSDGNTALHLSAAKPNFVNALLECKEIEVNIGNRNGVVPLMKFVSYPEDNASLQRLLTVESLNMNAADDNGNSVLHHAIRVFKRGKSTQHIVLLLNDPNLNVNLQNNVSGGCSALHECLMSNTVPLDYIQLLLRHPTTDVNLRTVRDGDTVLHIAIQLKLWNRNDDTRYMKLESILNHENIDKNVQNNAGKAPLAIARQQLVVVQGELVTAKSRLRRAQQRLTSKQIVYQTKSNVYQQKFTLYQTAKAQYDILYSQYQSAQTQYNSQPTEIQNRMTRPTAPSTSMYSSQEREMNSAKSTMESAASDVSFAEMNVNNALGHIELLEYKLYCAQLIIDALK